MRRLFILILCSIFSAAVMAGNIESPTGNQTPDISPAISNADNFFSVNEVAFGIYNKAWKVDIPTPPSPLFWKASHNVSSGKMLTYLHLIYHKNHFFTIQGGGTMAHWQGGGDNLYTISALLEFRLWLNLKPSWRLYFLYSVAAPTLMSNTHFNHTRFSTNFVFQDMMGIGMQLGQHHAFHIQAIIIHYSNGNLFPINGGIEVPLLISVGYSFP